MARLIDTDELLTRIRLNYNNHQNISANSIKDIIDTTKTAYDVEKVVEELEGLSLHYCEGHWGDYIDQEKAIEIVKAGGTNG